MLIEVELTMREEGFSMMRQVSESAGRSVPQVLCQRSARGSRLATAITPWTDSCRMTRSREG